MLLTHPQPAPVAQLDQDDALERDHPDDADGEQKLDQGHETASKKALARCSGVARMSAAIPHTFPWNSWITPPLNE